MSGQKYESIFVKNGFILTMTGKGVGMVEDGAVAIVGDQIVAVGKTRDLEKEHRGSEKVFNARGKAVLPGFVDAHVHTSNTIKRGMGQDVPEIEWMLKTASPFTQHTKPEHIIRGTALGVLEEILSGTTCIG